MNGAVNSNLAFLKKLWVGKNFHPATQAHHTKERKTNKNKDMVVLHPPNLPDQTMLVHVDLVKAEDRPPNLVQIPTDLADWIKQQDVGKCS